LGIGGVEGEGAGSGEGIFHAYDCVAEKDFNTEVTE